MSIEPKTPFEPQQRTIQQFNTEKKKKKRPAAKASYASANMANEAVIAAKTAVASPGEPVSPRGASIGGKKSPSVRI